MAEPENIIQVVRQVAGQNAALVDSLNRVARLSDYVQHNLLRYPDEIAEFCRDLEIQEGLPSEYYHNTLSKLLDDELSVVEFDATLRRIRRREMFRIIVRDFERYADLAETTRDLSLLAEAAIQTSLAYHTQAYGERYGKPRSPDGEEQKMCVLALGKLGAGELNLSSDIDLVFFYDRQGFTDGDRQTSNQEFFLRVSRALIASLDVTSAEGFVFRVDMRLRPYGESSPLIQHWAAFENYFVEQGRDWERYAYIKARPVAGDIKLGERFLAWLNPFVYRRHLDYGAIESLREMKLLINRQVASNDLQDDLKLGPGGIREVEFIAQAHQLIWGGTNGELQERRLRSVLRIMSSEGLLPEEDVQSLDRAYVFLRNSEHAIQGENDRQTQLLPEDEVSRGRLAKVMGYESYETYRSALDDHRGAVSACFSRFMSASEAEQEMLLEGDIFWQSLWREPDSEQALLLLEQAGFKEPSEASGDLSSFSEELLRQHLDEAVQQRINKLMPLLLSLVSRQKNPNETLNRLLPIIGAIERRSTYISYLLENLDALQRTVELCAMSPWVAERLNDHPILLYELTDRKTSDIAFTRQDLLEQMEDQLHSLDPLDLEAQMDTLRVYKNAVVLRVAVCELLNVLPIMKASDALTLIAEVVVQKAVELAWRYLTERHGLPEGLEEASGNTGFAVVAYGKLGGIELAYGSDLDLVFLVDTDIRGQTTGKRSVNNNVFYARMSQRIIHILTSFTRFGALYEVDMRLRPSGNKGPIVSTIANFRRYQTGEAWTWEHQALIRARYVAGDPDVGEQFSTVREEVLQGVRDRDELRRQVVEMREKMRTHLSGDSRDSDGSALLSGFDLKHEMGAIVDIEFMVQYAVLAWGYQHSVLSQWTDMMRILDEIGALELFDKNEVALLQEAYLAYRSAVHYQWLGGEMLSYDALNQYRQDVFALWQGTMQTSDQGGATTETTRTTE